MIIDPVLERVDRYLELVRKLDLKLVKAVDLAAARSAAGKRGVMRLQPQLTTVRAAAACP